jgi:hypothetical protein
MRRLVLLPFVMLVFACADSPTAISEQEAFAPSFKVLGGSGCYKVAIREYDVPGPTPGVLSGDLTGTSTFTNWSTSGPLGAAWLDSGTLIWDITGSIPELTELVGETLYVHAKQQVQFADGQYPVAPLSLQGTVVHDDVVLGRLAAHGGFDSTVPVLDATWKGTLCL